VRRAGARRAVSARLGLLMVPRNVYRVPLGGGGVLELGGRTLVMGILNVTPDSFADGGRYLDPDRAAQAALAMEAAGADLIDIGGESTRPGAEPVPAAEQLARIGPVLDRLAGRLRIPLSVDTTHAAVAEAALARGVALINDTSGLRAGPALARVVAAYGAALLLMHSRGDSRDMYREAHYGALMREVIAELERSLATAVAAGVPREQILVDPGLGFAKRAPHSLAALAQLAELAALDRPIVVGPSRKSFLDAALGPRQPDEREWGTAAAVAAAVLAGAHIVRVHGVAAMVDVVRVADAIRAHAAAFRPASPEE
jgi:dihydropteroate synthase